MTSDEYKNWFPHPSPDGRTLVFLSYEKDVIDRPANEDVTLRRMTLDTGAIGVLGRFFGGEGTINAPSWSPDGRQIAFVIVLARAVGESAQRGRYRGGSGPRILARAEGEAADRPIPAHVLFCTPIAELW